MKKQPTSYELRVIEEIRREIPKSPKGLFANLMGNVNHSLHRAASWLGSVPGLEKVLQQLQEMTTQAFQHWPNTSQTIQGVITSYARAGYPQIQSAEDVGNLTLKEVEDVVGALRKKYQLLAEESSDAHKGQEASDIIALITLNQQAIQEFATAYGFDIDLQQERIFALNIMEYAAADDEATREMVLQRMIRMARDIALGGAERTSSKASFLDTLKAMSNSVTIRLLKAKIGEVIPLSGAVIGGGFNAYFTHEVCDIAQLVYRKRFLLEKYGEDIFELTEGTPLESDEDSSL